MNLSRLSMASKPLRLSLRKFPQRNFLSQSSLISRPFALQCVRKINTNTFKKTTTYAKSASNTLQRMGLRKFATATAGQASRGSQIGLIAVGGAATFGLLSIVAKGLSENKVAERTALEGAVGAEQYLDAEVRSRLRSTYSYVCAGLGSTALFATAMFRSGVAQRLMRMNPWLLMGGSLVAMIGTMVATRSFNYNDSFLAKHVAWSAFNGAIALSLCPLGYFGGQILFQAALATGILVGSLSAVAAVAPSDQFLHWGGGLSIGLGVVIAASFGQMIFPQSSILYNIALYGGLGIFSLFTLHDTQKILATARATEYEYDPIDTSIGVYLDIINIFVRMVQIMAQLGGKRRR